MELTRRKALAAVGSAALAGCTGLGSSSDESLADGAEVNLLLNWTPNGLHVPYYLAKANGYYEEAGFEDVTIENGDGSDVSAQQAGLGNTEFGITSSEQLLNVNTRELSPLCAAVVMQRGQTVLYTAREQFGEELTDPSQLEGKTIGVGPGAVELMTEAYLSKLGLEESTETVETGFEGTQMLLNGEIDVNANVFSDSVGAQAQGYTIDMLDVADEIQSYGHLIATSSDFAEENSETVEAFLRATARGCAMAIQNPEEGVDALIDANPDLGEIREQHRTRWDLMSENYMLSDAVENQGWGWSEPEPWEETYETLDSGGMLDEEIDPDTVWTNEYLDTDSEYVGEFTEVIE
jgi:NitT/TauT family transport system substrate-binding protein